MELSAGTLVTARKPNNRKRSWRRATVQEDFDGKSESTKLVVLKFEGDSTVYQVPYYDIKLSNPTTWNSLEPRVRALSKTPAESQPSQQVIDLVAADNVLEIGGDAGLQAQHAPNGINTGLDDVARRKAWLMEQEAKLEREKKWEEAKKREDARKRLEAARVEDKKKRLEAAIRDEAIRRDELPNTEREKLLKDKNMSNGGVSFSFAQYIDQRKDGSRRLMPGERPSLYEQQIGASQKRKLDSLHSGGDTDLGQGFTTTTDDLRPLGKRRRSSIDFGQDLPHRVERDTPNVESHLVERHPVAASNVNYPYRIPRKPAFRASSAASKSRLERQAPHREGIPFSNGIVNHTRPIAPESLGSPISGGIRAAKKKRRRAKRVATQFEPSTSPFSDDMLYDDQDTKVFDVCRDLLVLDEVEEVSQESEHIAINVIIVKMGRGRKCKTPKRRSCLGKLRVDDVCARMAKQSAQRKQQAQTMTMRQTTIAAAVWNTPGNITNCGRPRRADCPKNDAPPLILQCVCEKSDATEDRSSVVQCRVCGLWSHLACTQDYHNAENAKNIYRNIQKRFMCITCVERSTTPIHPHLIISDDELDTADHVRPVTRNKTSSFIQVRSLTQLLNDLEIAECEEASKAKASKPQQNHRNNRGINRPPLTQHDVWAREDNIETLRSGVITPYTGEREQKLMDVVMRKGQRCNSKTRKSRKTSSTTADPVSVTRVVLNKT